MKRRQKIPDDTPVYYYKKDPFNITIRHKALSKGILLQYRSKSSFIHHDNLKPALSKKTKDSTLATPHLTNNTQTHTLSRTHSLFNNIKVNNKTYSRSKSRYSMNILEKLKNKKEFEDKIQFLYSQIEIKPTVNRWVCNGSNKNIIRTKSYIERPIEMKVQLERSYQRIPSIYKSKVSKYNHHQYINKHNHKSFDQDNDADYNRNRYEKPKINIEEVIRNYNANAKKWFSCEKIKMYHIKISPFLSRMQNNL